MAVSLAYGQARPDLQRGPYLNLSDGRAVSTRYDREDRLAGARALSTTKGDFDEDGMPDLVAGFATAGGGAVVIHRGNVDALWPYGALRGTEPPAFLPNARVFALPESPDFLAAGDFDADGHWDIVAARAGSGALYWLKGDGHGGFATARRVALPGRVTAMTSGDINRADGLTDLMVAVTGGAGPQVLVFESPRGALSDGPESFPLPADAASMAVIGLDGGLVNGVAVAAGQELLLIHGRDRKLTRSREERAGVAAAEISRQSLGFTVRSLAVGSFTSGGQDLAALGDDGRVHILERSDVGAAIGRVQVDGLVPTRRLSARGPAGPLPKTTGMKLSRSIDLPIAPRADARLVTSRVAATGRDSLVVLDRGRNQLHVVSHRTRGDRGSLAVTASLNVAGVPAAVESMRINKDAWHDLVVLSESRTQPVVHTTAAAVIYTVTNTNDSGNGSLRDGITFMNGVAVSGMTGEIDFNIPATDLNRDPTTGVFTIQPLFQNNLEALPPLAGMTLDGFTQPGSTPNTLTNGDNAHPLIEINGSMAGKGPNGIALQEGTSLVRGLVVTNFLGTPDPNDSRYVDGGGGFDIESENNIVEGNFIGIDAGGTFAKPNSGGIFTYSGPATQFGSIVGGTTPQARNLISGNLFSGVYEEEPAYANTFLVQGNYIGTDKTGTHAVPNHYAGIDVIGYNGVIGGTVAGAGNLISSNGFGVVVQVGGQGPHGNLIQGNRIGTDVTGTQVLASSSGDGVGMVFTEGDTVGGTTPAARNIISGNAQYGMYFVGANANDVIEGNYIGTDVTGTTAVPNGSDGIHFGTDFGDVFGQQHSGAPVQSTLIGGEGAGASNVISGNHGAGISVISKSGFTLNNVFAGNFIGTDATGANAIGNHGDGISFTAYSSGNTVGGTDPAAANVIANNGGNGITIDPGSPNTATFGVSSNTVIGNSIVSNTGAGVRIPSGTSNKVSGNRISSNGALGIDIDAAGVMANSACQANTSGANKLQNAPVLTAASGSTFVSATATDSVGNTSEFSNCVAAALSGNVLSIAGTLNSAASSTYTIEYFSNTSCDSSSHGQGATYLGSASVTTSAGCTAPIATTLTLNNADLSVTNTSGNTPITNMTFAFTSVVTNNGPSSAASVTWSDTLQSGVTYLAATSTQGTCGAAGGVITCSLGTMPVGGTATISVSVVPMISGNFTNTVSVSSAATDPNTANNSATFSKTIASDPYLNHLTPSAVNVGSPDTAITLVGQGFTTSTVVTYNGTTYPATFNGSWNPSDCGPALFGGANYCTALTITVPAANFTAPATVQVGITTTLGPITIPFNVVTPPVAVGPVTHFGLTGVNTPYAAGSAAILTVTALDANNLTVTNYTGTVNLTTTDPNPTVFTAGGGTASLSFTASSHGQASTIVELQTMGTQSITATDAANASLHGTTGSIVVTHGAAANMVLSGTPQAALPGHSFAASLKVTVTDLYGNPVPNQTITFTAPTTGASATVPATATTNASGVASVTAMANGTSGAYAIGATFGAAVAGGGDNADVFLLTNGSGLATLTATAGTPQSTFIGTLFATHLQATLLDGLGSPISGATVYFTSGNVNGASALVTGSAVTNASGVATATANAPGNASAGTFPVTATAGGLTDTFTLTETVPAPVQLSVVSGSNQTTASGTAFGAPLVVKVVDANGNPRTGVVVTFVPPSSGASATFTTGTASTDSSGQASVIPTANGTQGTYTVTASVGGVSVSFTLTNGPAPSGTPASIVANAGTPQSATVNLAFGTALKVLVKDASNTPLPGASVTFRAPSTGASGSFASSATVTTNGAGIATAPTFSANTTAGSYVVTATATGGLSTTFSLTNNPGGPSTMTKYAGDNQSATINTNYGTALAVLLRDTYGNPVSAGWGVSFFTVPVNNAGATFAGSTSVTTNSSGLAIAPNLTANGTAGQFLAFALYSSQEADFTLTNTTAAPAAITVISGTPQSAVGGAGFAQPLTVKVTDSGGNPLQGFTVNFAVPGSGASATLATPSVVTSASGIASTTATANTVAGSYHVTASIGALNTTFALTNSAPPASKCDINHDNSVNASDIQAMINQALGGASPANDLNGDHVANAVDVQIVANAVLNLGCSAQ